MNSVFRVALRQFSTAGSKRAGGQVPQGRDRQTITNHHRHPYPSRIQAAEGEAEDVQPGQRPEGAREGRHGGQRPHQLDNAADGCGWSLLGADCLYPCIPPKRLTDYKISEP